MTGKSNIELLIESPRAMIEFREAMAERATVCELEDEIRKLSHSLREHLSTARVCDLDISNLLNYRREQKHDRLLACAYAIGKERGTRLGKSAARRMIMEAYESSEQQLKVFAPWLDEAVTEEDSEARCRSVLTAGVTYH